jgi:hypothetical protein
MEETLHTIKVIAIGCALLALCLIIGRAAGGATAGLVAGAKVFLPLWLIGAGINMWLGVSKAGYSVAEEAPVFVLVFAVPAAVAVLVWWRVSRG